VSVEDRVLSAVLKDKQIHVLMLANPDRLFTTHKDIWEFVRFYYEENQTTPPIDLVEDRFGYFIVDDTVGSTKYHVNELKTQYLNDNIIEIAKRAALLHKEDRSSEALDMIIQESARIKRETTSVRDIDMTSVEDAVEYFKLVDEMNKAGSFGIKTGLAGFDNYLPSGMMPGHFGVFLAYPQIGKSWLMLYFAVQAWLQGKKPLIISLEMSESEVRNRAYTIIGEGVWSHRKISAGDIDIDDFKKWATKHLEGKPTFQVVSTEGLGEVTPALIRGKIDQYKPDIVFVDYLQLMSPDGGSIGDPEPVKIKNLSRQFKLLARSAEVPIMAIASATPDDVTDMNSVPALGQVRWGKDIAYDADYVLALGREKASDIIQCIFRKNRHGYEGEFLIEVDFDKGLWRYRDFEDQL